MLDVDGDAPSDSDAVEDIEIDAVTEIDAVIDPVDDTLDVADGVAVKLGDGELVGVTLVVPDVELD